MGTSAAPSADLDPDFVKWLQGVNAQSPGVMANGDAPTNVDGSPVAQATNVDDEASPAITPANPNVGPVPSFTPPDNPIAQAHKTGVMGFLQRFGHGVENAVSPVSDGDAALTTPHDRQQAQAAGFLALGNRLLNPEIDRNGFRQSTLGSLAGGIQDAQKASQGSIGGSIQAAQQATTVQQAQQVRQQRFAIGTNVTQRLGQLANDKEGQISLLQQAAASSNAISDKEGEKTYTDLAKAIRDGRIANANNLKIIPGNYGRHVVYDTAAGKIVDTIVDPNEQFKKDDVSHDNALMDENYKQRAELHYDSDNIQHAKAFATENKSLVDGAGPMNSLYSVLRQARNGNSAAYTSTIINLMQALDAKAQVRQQMLDQVSSFDKSIGGNMDRLVAKYSNGTLPPEVIENLYKLADEKTKGDKALYTQRYLEQLQHVPQSAAYIPIPDQVFPVGMRDGIDVPTANVGRAGATPSAAPAPKPITVAKKPAVTKSKTLSSIWGTP